MARLLTIGLIGDYLPEVRAHQAIGAALKHAGDSVALDVQPRWFPTSEIFPNALGQLEACDGLWCVPASPYKSMTGALSAIRFARERGRPFLGTCGGFQHAVIEYARNVIGETGADHAESNPGTRDAWISALSCSLVGQKGTIRLSPGSAVARIYGTSEIVEEYHCNYGLSAGHQERLERCGLRITGHDQNSEPRILELPAHPFFIGTLFQPELTPPIDWPHPLILAFVKAASQSAR